MQHQGEHRSAASAAETQSDTSVFTREATLINWAPGCSRKHQARRFLPCIALNRCLRPRRVRRSCNRFTTEAHVISVLLIDGKGKMEILWTVP